MKKTNSHFIMTSSEKKILKLNKTIRILVFLLIISIVFNGSLIKYIMDSDGTNNNPSVSDGIIEKVLKRDKTTDVSDSNILDEDLVNEKKGNKLDLGIGNYIKDKSDIYSILYNEIIAGKTKIDVNFEQNTITGDDIFDEYRKVLYDHPEIFWLNGGANGSGYVFNNLASYTIELSTSCDMSNIDKMRDELDDAVNRIVMEAKSYDSDYDRVKAVHDLIIKECDYDMDAFNTLMTKGNDYVDALVYSPYGCLVNKKAVCNGYATAFQLVMNKLGIECGLVTGTGTNDLGSGPHAWNYVLIDGKYLYVDVTWDDPIYDEGAPKPEEIRQDYLCISLEEMSKNHFADEGQYLPQ